MGLGLCWKDGVRLPVQVTLGTGRATCFMPKNMAEVSPATPATPGTLWNHCALLGFGKVSTEMSGWGTAGLGLGRPGAQPWGRIQSSACGPRPPAFSVLLLYCLLSPVGLELVCVCWEGRLKKGRGGLGRVPGGGLELFCLLSFSFEFISNPSLTVLSVLSLSCLSICLSQGREGKEGPWASISLGNAV